MRTPFLFPPSSLLSHALSSPLSILSSLLVLFLPAFPSLLSAFVSPPLFPSLPFSSLLPSLLPSFVFPSLSFPSLLFPSLLPSFVSPPCPFPFPPCYSLYCNYSHYSNYSPYCPYQNIRPDSPQPPRFQSKLTPTMQIFRKKVVIMDFKL